MAQPASRLSTFGSEDYEVMRRKDAWKPGTLTAHKSLFPTKEQVIKTKYQGRRMLRTVASRKQALPASMWPALVLQAIKLPCSVKPRLYLTRTSHVCTHMHTHARCTRGFFQFHVLVAIPSKLKISLERISNENVSDP